MYIGIGNVCQLKSLDLSVTVSQAMSFIARVTRLLPERSERVNERKGWATVAVC